MVKTGVKALSQRELSGASVSGELQFASEEAKVLCNEQLKNLCRAWDNAT